MLYTPESVSGSIVAIGSFNPAIVTPDWLEAGGLIGKDDAKVIREDRNFVVTRQVTQLTTETFVLLIEEGKFQATSKGTLSPALRDLAMGVFELLPHTPITALGQNFDTIFKFLDTDAYHRVGDTLAPKTIWDRVYPQEQFTAGLDVLTIKIQEGSRNHVSSNDYRNITVQRAAMNGPAIRFSYNDHHDLSDTENRERPPADVAIEILRSQWELAWKDASRAFSEVLELAVGGA